MKEQEPANATNTPVDAPIWTLEDIRQHYRLSQSGAKRLVAQLDFPKPVIGPRNRRWLQSDVRGHVEAPKPVKQPNQPQAQVRLVYSQLTGSRAVKSGGAR